MNAQIVEELTTIFGDRATTALFERGFYERDLAPVPNFLVKPIANTLPDIVIRPQNTEEVAAIVKLAAENRIPVTARSGGSTVYFNTVCMHNGILVDLNGLNRLVAVDNKNNTVRVGAGMTWWNLERALQQAGLAACSYPSSAQAATIGGWLVMMGYGIGSLQYGPVIDQVLAAQTVMPDGSVQQLTARSQPPVAWLAASEGTLGLVTEVELKVRRYPEMQWHGLAEFADSANMQCFIEKVVESTVKPFNLHFSDPGCNALRQRLSMASERAAQAYTVAFDADGSKAETQAASRLFHQCRQLTDGGDLGQEGEHEWQQRFFSLVLKREGPSLLGAEIWLPIRHLASYLQDIALFERNKQLGLTTYGHVVTPEHAMVMTMFKADERDTIGYLQGLALVKKVHDIGAKYGGSPYGVGLWNTPYLKRIHSSAAQAELTRRKKLLDPYNIMNPGKLYQTPLLLKQPMFNVGMDLLAATTAVYRGTVGRKQQ